MVISRFRYLGNSTMMYTDRDINVPIWHISLISQNEHWDSYSPNPSCLRSKARLLSLKRLSIQLSRIHDQVIPDSSACEGWEKVDRNHEEVRNSVSSLSKSFNSKLLQFLKNRALKSVNRKRCTFFRNQKLKRQPKEFSPLDHRWLSRVLTSMELDWHKPSENWGGEALYENADFISSEDILNHHYVRKFFALLKELASLRSIRIHSAEEIDELGCLPCLDMTISIIGKNDSQTLVNSG
ncbi:hypothetical protein QAD02_012607 [Eretmocerus hayati]|uniref:Uncharacterized protein n=1 Tax=Eretmocerus hayati TaxID=131215 RepID=A0ACC2P064_9HYME|nr:hypothetical protein QAD02_012607 [Eretmocerus hayati]